MIHQASARAVQAVRAYSFDRKVYDRSRRAIGIGIGLSLGTAQGTGAAGGTNFATLLDSLTSAGSTVGYYRSDLGLSTTGSVVNTWANQSTSANKFGNCVEGSAGVGIGSVTAGVGGKAGVASNATTQYGKITTVPSPLVAPATTPLNMYIVARSTALPSANSILVGNSGFNFTIVQLPSSLTVEMYNGAAQATALVTNAWARARASFTGTTSDEIKWGSAAAVTGTSCLNNPSGTLSMGVFAAENGGNVSPWEIALLLLSTASAASFKAAAPTLDAAVTAFYGGTVSV